MKRKILVTLLAFCLIASLCVVGAAASDAQEETANIASITTNSTTNSYTTVSAFVSAVNSLSSAATIEILDDFSVNAVAKGSGDAIFEISQSVTINGNGNTITVSKTEGVTEAGHVFSFNAGNSTLSDLTIDGQDIARHGIHVWTGSGATQTSLTIDNVTSMNCITGLTVNGSAVTASDFVTSGNAWGGVNVDPKGNNASFTMNSGDLSAETTSVYINNDSANGTAAIDLNGGEYAAVGVATSTDNVSNVISIDNCIVDTVGIANQAGTSSIVVSNSKVTTSVDTGSVVVIDSTVAGVPTDSAPDGVVAVIGGQQFASLQAAIDSITTSDPTTIILVANADMGSINKTISDKDITIVGNGYPVIATVGTSGGETAIGISLSNTKLTLDNVDMTVNGTEWTANNSNAGQAFDVKNNGSALNIVNGSHLTLQNLQTAFVLSGKVTDRGEIGEINIEDSAVTITNIDGNASNGGDWTVSGSTISYTNIGSHALSVETATINSSDVAVNGSGLCGIMGADISIINGSIVTVTGSGSQLPQESQWAPNSDAYNYAVELKKNGKLTVEDSILTLSGNVNDDGVAIDNIFVSAGTTTDTANGTVNAGFVVAEGSDQLVVRMMDGNVQYSNQTVTKGDSVYLPTLSKSGYTFTGWRVNNSNTIVKGGESYPITANTTFTAVWNMIMIPDTYDIAVDQPAHGTVDVSFSNASQGSVITVTATPDEGYELVYITVDGEPISGNSFVMPDHAVEVSALFAEIGKEVNFVDVSRADWFYDYVQYVAQNGLMEGTTRTAFEPNASMTRAMFWTVLARIDGETITGDAWKTLAQTWAVESGISDGTNADALITREQMVTMLYRYAGSPVTGGMAISEFTDSASVSDYATDAVTWALSEGILTGMGDGILAPQGTATRAQAAAMLMRFVEA